MPNSHIRSPHAERNLATYNIANPCFKLGVSTRTSPSSVRSRSGSSNRPLSSPSSEVLVDASGGSSAMSLGNPSYPTFRGRIFFVPTRWWHAIRRLVVVEGWLSPPIRLRGWIVGSSPFRKGTLERKRKEGPSHRTENEGDSWIRKDEERNDHLPSFLLLLVTSIHGYW